MQSTPFRNRNYLEEFREFIREYARRKIGRENAETDWLELGETIIRGTNCYTLRPLEVMEFVKFPSPTYVWFGKEKLEELLTKLSIPIDFLQETLFLGSKTSEGVICSFQPDMLLDARGTPPWLYIEDGLHKIKQDLDMMSSSSSTEQPSLIPPTAEPDKGKGSNESTQPAEMESEATVDDGKVTAQKRANEATGNAKVDTDDEISRLEASTPSLDKKDKSRWVKSKGAAEIEGLETPTLTSYRHQGLKNAAETLGCDKDGRVWRREGTPRSHIWYLRSTLCKSESKSTPEP